MNSDPEVVTMVDLDTFVVVTTPGTIFGPKYVAWPSVAKTRIRLIS